MEDFSQQLIRIKKKLLEAKHVDKDLKVFGADYHKYLINKPATLEAVQKVESTYSIKLPACYRSFLLHIGNGGTSHSGSGAGPYLGIYPLGEDVGELTHSPLLSLKNDCLLHPKMSAEFWQSLSKNTRVDADNKGLDNNDDYDELRVKLYGGILPIGSQGCTYLHGIVLNGKYEGRVVNLDADGDGDGDGETPRFTFAFENNFLDWYERWLDEVISKELIHENAGWFGYTMGGSDTNLVATFLNSASDIEKNDCLEAILRKQKIENATIHIIENELLNRDTPFKTICIQLLSKFDYRKAEPHLIDLMNTDLLSVFQCVYWYAKDKCSEWVPRIETKISGIDDKKTFDFCGYILKESKSDCGKLLVPFTKHTREDMRKTAYYGLGQISNRQAFIETFIEGLNDNSNQVIHTTLQALSGIKDNRLLKHYKRIAENFPFEKDSILVNLNHRLADFGLDNKSIQQITDETLANWNQQTSKKKWFDFLM